MASVGPIPPGGGDDTCLRDLEASFFIWESLWQRNQQTAFIKYNLLDAVGVDTAEVKLWLFTSADGLVKSKARHRFNADSVADRCAGVTTSGGAKLSGHYTTDGFDWKQLHRKEQIQGILGYKTPAAIVSYGHIYGNLTWLETTYEVDELGIQRPKCTTCMLCGSKAMGTALTDDNTSVVPGEKIKSKNKALNECARKALSDLVRHVETRRSGVQVRRVVAVFMCESEEDLLEGGAGDGSRVLWLHHVREIVTRGKRHKGGGGGSVAGSVADSYYSDLRSESSARRSLACSDILHNTSTFNRPTKCQGDFCRYSEQEEILIMKTIGTKTASVIAEARKAMRRHNSKSAVSSALDEVGDIVAEDDEETPLGADAGTFDAESIPPAGQARHVPYKSVALARHEMKDLEAAMNGNVDFASSPPQHPSAARGHGHGDGLSEGPNPASFCNADKVWPERLRHWWTRIGKSMAQRRVDAVPDSSASYSTVNITSAAMDKAHQKRLPKGRTLAESHGEAGDSKFKPKVVVRMPVGGSPRKRPAADEDDDERSAGVSTIGASVASALSKAVPYDLSENSFGAHKRKNLGEVSWYYSDARVCDKCYRVYQDLDKRRKHVENKLLELRRAATEETEHTSEKDRERERREFEQRKFTSRIAQVRLKPVEGTENEYTTYVDHRSDVGIAGGGRRRNGGGGGGGRGVVGAPKGVLPPMPWQLKDGDKLQKYQQIGSSFIRNIGSKARDVATDAHHLRMMAELERIRGVGGGALLGSATDERLGAAGGGDPEKDIERQWEQITRGAAQLRAASEGGNPLHRAPAKQQSRSFAAADKAQTTSEVKTFDRSRLMHSYQRDMEKMRAAMERGEDVDVAALGGTGAPAAASGPRIVVVKKKGLGAGGKLKRAPRRADGSGNGNGNGNGMFYQFDDVSRLTDKADRGPLYPPPAQQQFVHLSQYERAQRRGVGEDDDDDGGDGDGAGMGVEDHNSRIVNLPLKHPDASAPSRPAPASIRTDMRKAKSEARAGGGLGGLDAASWVSDAGAGDPHGLDRAQSGKRAVSFAPPPTDTYKIPPVTGGLGAMYGRSAPAPSAGGGPAPASAVQDGNAYLVRMPASLSGGRAVAAADDDDDDDGEDDDDDDDEGIGWSPFVVPVSK